MSSSSNNDDPLCAIIFHHKGKDSKLSLLNQCKLPTTEWISVTSVQQGADAIRKMVVRGAPAIAIAAMLSLATELERRFSSSSLSQTDNELLKDANLFLKDVKRSLDILSNARPTAVNCSKACQQVESKLKAHIENSCDTRYLIDFIVNNAKQMMVDDVAANKAIGEFGRKLLIDTAGRQQLNVLTHCNTGSLATANYGTALGVIRALDGHNQLTQCFCTETRPYNQGSRLTAYELVCDKIPGTLISDSMAAFAMAKKQIHAVVVGADRVAANGDTANKIGTYMLAVCAKHHGIPFFVCSPQTTLDISTKSGQDIEIEQRAPQELRQMNGHQLAPESINVWNPAFDITPAALISAIITDIGVIMKKDGIFDVESFLQKN